MTSVTVILHKDHN